MSVAQSLALGAILFTLYRYLIRALGIEQVGVWSFVLSTAAATRIAELGISAGVVRFVAVYAARGEVERVSLLVQTAAISAGTLVGLMMLTAYPLAGWLLSLVLQGSSLSAAVSLLPFALVSLWIGVISSIFQSGLDGIQRSDLRSWLLIIGEAFHLTMCFVLVPSQGLIGLGYARVVQSLLVALASWLLLRRFLNPAPWAPHRWHRGLFGEMTGYGVSFQITAVVGILYDPITKGLLTSFGGVAMTGYYEMASRMITQLRGIIVTANQTLVPVIADLQERKPELLLVFYSNCYNLLIYVGLPCYALVVASAPIISEFWIGHYESRFVLFSALLGAGWFLNMLNAPAYYDNLGTGALRWNTISHVLIGVLNLALGWLFGNLWGGFGVAFAWAVSLAVGSNVVTMAYHSKNRIPLAELLPNQSRKAALASVAAVIAVLVIYFQLRPVMNMAIVAILSGAAFAGIMAIPLWAHPMRKQLYELIFRGVENVKIA